MEQYRETWDKMHLYQNKVNKDSPKGVSTLVAGIGDADTTFTSTLRLLLDEDMPPALPPLIPPEKGTLAPPPCPAPAVAGERATL